MDIKKQTIQQNPEEFKGLLAILSEIKNVSAWLWEKGWAERNAGNISVDVTDIITIKKWTNKSNKIPMKIGEPILANRLFLVTGTGVRLRDIKREPQKCLLLVQISETVDGYYIIDGNRKIFSTSEFISHLLIHSFLLKNKVDKKAIIHTHPNHIIALSHIKKYSSENMFNRLIWSIHPEVKVVIPEGVGYVKYNCPGTERLARATLKKLKDRRLIIWERHGCVAIGKDLYEAFDLIDTVDKAIEIFFICRNAGYNPQGLNSIQLKELEKIFNLKKNG